MRPRPIPARCTTRPATSTPRVPASQARTSRAQRRLIKQAHLNWDPDTVRTALINTATNLRSAAGTPKADGSTADDIISQGGGLIDVYGAINTKAIMGVAGDGIVQPSILGSYSFGEAPILNNRIVNTKSVTVTVQDLSGQGGTYNLATANNRYFDRPGITAGTSVKSVSVPAGGAATFTATSVSTAIRFATTRRLSCSGM